MLGTPRAARLTTIKTNVRLGDAVGPIHFTAIIAIIINTIIIILIITIIIVFISSSLRAHPLGGWRGQGQWRGGGGGQVRRKYQENIF